MTPPLEREAIMPRIDGIRKNLVRLRALGALPFDEFKVGDSFDLAQHHLRLALEGVFHIGAHILSRLPGGRAVEYQQIALKLGALDVVEKKFAQGPLVAMAGMRNLLVHHYSDVNQERLYAVLRDHLDDVEIFLKAAATVCAHPEKWGLTLE